MSRAEVLKTVLNKTSTEVEHLEAHLEVIEEFMREVSPELIDGEDLRQFLPDEEYRHLAQCFAKVSALLNEYRSRGEEPTLVVYMKEIPYNIRFDIQELLCKAYDRKNTQKAREIALKRIAPPLEEARQYLNQAEYQQFRESIPDAIDAYLARDLQMEAHHPGFWLLGKTAMYYRWWTELIERKQRAEAEQRRAERERDEHIKAVSVAVVKLKKELRHVKKPKMAVHPALKGHKPEYWCELQLPDKAEVYKWTGQRIREWLPQVLVDVTGWQLGYQFQIVPEADYENINGIPCLAWTFDTNILVTAVLKLAGGLIWKLRPGGYVVEEPAEGEVMGTLYLGPHEWFTPGSFTTPMALLSLFAKGEMEVPGVIVEEHRDGYTSFSIAGLEEAVEVHEDFRRFIKEINEKQPLGKALLSAGFVDKDTAHLIEVKEDIPLPDSTLVPAASIEAADSGPVIAALEGMGYQKAEINEAIPKVVFFSGMSLEDKIKAVLQALCT